LAIDGPYDGLPLLADTSAWTNAHKLTGTHRTDWEAALRNEQIATCDAVVYELGQGAQTNDRLLRLRERFSALRRLDITDSEWHAALRAIDQLAAASPGGGHRGLSLADALVAVTAEAHGMAVLHYDSDFDRLKAVVNCAPRAIAPMGSL
jgi:hypothetical protein